MKKSIILILLLILTINYLGLSSALDPGLDWQCCRIKLVEMNNSSDYEYCDNLNLTNEDCDKIMKDFEKVQAQWLAQVYSQNSYGGVILIGVLIVIAIIVYYIVKKRRNKSKQ